MVGKGRFFVGGNWKCNETTAEVQKLVSELNDGEVPSDIEIVVAPTYIHLQMVKDTLKPPYQIAAQNSWVKGTGAYTGEIAPELLVDLGIGWVILGHSERRALINESNEMVADKTDYALHHGLKTIVCIGETLEQRESGELWKVLEGQLNAVADKLSMEDWDGVVVAYEPVWAIGTGKVASPEQAQEVHAFIRKWAGDKVSSDMAVKLRIIYGGSVNDKNANELASQEDIDGFLVGGASLKGPAFVTIANASKFHKNP
jgi:triosephosphate isomerase